jgi:hypothetical protein
MLRVGDTTTDHLKVEGSNVFLGREDTSASIAYVYNAEDDRKELTVGTGTATWSATETVGGTNTKVTVTADSIEMNGYLRPTLTELESDTAWVVNPALRQTGYKVMDSPEWADTTALVATKYDLTQLGAVPINNFIYVDGRGGNDATAKVGDLAHPFKTLRGAVDSFATGRVIIVYPATYSEETTSNSGEGFNLCRQSNGTYITPVAYFYKGARLVKSAGTGHLVFSATTGAYIYGEGTFIRNGTGTNCQAIRILGYECYVEADSVYCTRGTAVTSNTSGCVFKVKMAQSTEKYTYAGSQFNIIGRTNQIKNSSSYAIIYIDNVTTSTTMEGVFTHTVGSQNCVHAAGTITYVTISGEFYSPGGKAVYVEAGRSFKLEVFQTNCTYILHSHYASSYSTASVHYYGASSPIVYQSGATGGVIDVYHYGNTMVAIDNRVGTINLYGHTDNTSITASWIYMTGGTVNVDGVFSFSGGSNYDLIKQAGGNLIINGQIYDAITAGGNYTQGSLLNVIAAGGTLVIGPKAKISEKSSSTVRNGVIGIGYNCNVICQGGFLDGNTDDWGLMVMSNNKGENNDTVAVSLYAYENIYSNKPFATRASTRDGNAFGSGYDFNANPKSFLINYNGGGDKTMNLTTDCNTIQDVIDAVNAELTVEGLTDLECVLTTATTMKLRNKFSTTADGNMISEIVLTEVDALAVLGWAAGTYKAAIYVKGNGTGALKFDANNIIY